MPGSQPLDARQQFIEEVGLFFEHSGLTRMAGRVLGWLLVCDPPHQTMPDLADALQASKGSISSATRLLIQYRLVQRISLPGQRRDFYRIQSDAWTELLRTKLGEMRLMRELAERGLALMPDNDDQRQRLEHMRSVYAFFEREMPLLVERLEQTISAE